MLGAWRSASARIGPWSSEGRSTPSESQRTYVHASIRTHGRDSGHWRGATGPCNPQSRDERGPRQPGPRLDGGDEPAWLASNLLLLVGHVPAPRIPAHCAAFAAAGRAREHAQEASLRWLLSFCSLDCAPGPPTHCFSSIPCARGLVADPAAVCSARHTLICGRVCPFVPPDSNVPYERTSNVSRLHSRCIQYYAYLTHLLVCCDQRCRPWH